MNFLLALIHFAMTLHTTDHYSSEDIYQARNEIFQLQNNLHQIEELYQKLYVTLDGQQAHVDEITTSVNQTVSNLDKGQEDLFRILQTKRQRTKWQYFLILFIITTALICLVIVINVLANVIKTFGFQRIIQPTRQS